MEDLPEDVTTEILSRLPAESLLRCKRVRKSWYVLLKTPNFASKHVSYQRRFSGGDVFLKRWDPKGCLHPEAYTMCALSAGNVEDPQVFPLPSTFHLCNMGIVLIGHCDGLIALGNNDDGIVVCNPATRDFHILPDSSLRPIPYDHDYDLVTSPCVARNNFLGFGYDYKINDYKLVRVVDFYRSYSLKHRVEVFCIRTDSCWRQLDAILLDSTAHEPGLDDISREPYFEGACYWWAHDTSRKNCIVSFHMTDEVFTKIPVPALGSTQYWEKRVSVGVYKNSIALYVYPEYDHDQIDIWGMKEFGVEESWSKQLSVKLPVDGSIHLGFWNGTDGEFLWADPDGQLGICNRFTMESKILSMPGTGERWTIVPYMKTIVSPNPHAYSSSSSSM